jgi:predicted O-methyltransferase YrrM
MSFRFIFKFLNYQLFAKHRNGHGIHSPFVYDLLTNIIEDETPFYCFENIEKLRSDLLKNSETITVTDLGAGSKKNKSNQRKIKDIAKFSMTTERNAQLLFRLVNHFKPHNIIELGTSLGLTTLYLSFPNKNANIYTIEGCPEIAKVASKIFAISNVSNIKQYVGNFDVKLPEVLHDAQQADFVFFDGNHRKEPTINYFNMCLPHISENSVFIFDDIHWSQGMEEAWNEIKQNEQVSLTIDLFYVGLVFFKKDLQKQDFVIKF